MVFLRALLGDLGHCVIVRLAQHLTLCHVVE